MPPTDIPIRPPVSNAGWNPETMLRKARAGEYPTAKSQRPSREVPGMTEAEAEVAYWQGRCGEPVDFPEPEPDEAPAPHGHAAELDAAFLELSPRKRRALVHNYLVSGLAVDQEHGAHLCALAGLDVARERAAAEQTHRARMDRALARLRAQPSRKERAKGGATLWESWIF